MWGIRGNDVPLHLTMRQLAAFLLFLLLLLSCTDGERMRQRLNDLQAANQADSLLTDDSLALALTDYFDRHGTANEQMLAHYLLGRTYADMGEAPAALDAFHQAADCADTTAVDCDYYILSRVYAQMSSVFYHQNLMSDYMEYLNYSITAAERANDTIMALNEFAHKMEYYDRTNHPDSVIRIGEMVYQKFNLWGYKQMAAKYLGYTIISCLKEGEYNKARRYMDVFESQSDLFDSCHQIAKGREIYYYSKGLYYLYTQQYDSAECFFRKELQEGKDFNNQNAASHGLALLFKKTHQSDSAMKYALYSYDMNDSITMHFESDAILQAHALYNYERSQHIANQKSKEAAESKSIIWMCLVIIFVLVFTLYLYVKHIRKRREKEYLQYRHNLELLDQYKTDVENLEAEKNTFSDRLSSVIDDAQEKIAQLEVQISNYEKKAITKARGALVQQIRETSVYKRLRKIADQPTAIPSLQDWQELRQVFDRIVPNFYATLYSGDYSPNETEYHLCMLIWLQFSPSDISNLIAMSNAYVSVARKKLLKNIFKTDGSAKEFDIKIREIT